MNNLCQIRRAVETDAAILCAAERTAAHMPGLLISQPDELREMAFVEKIRGLVDVGCYLVAEKDGALVGHAVLEPLAPLKSLAHVFTLSSIVVHTNTTGQGIGTELMRALLAWACTKPTLEKIELRVRDGNERALRLYRRFGFIEEGRFEKRI